MLSTAEKWGAPDGIPPIAIASSIKLPWQPLFWSDFLLSTAHLLPLELGCYLRLYGYYWQTGSLPRHHERCFGIASAISPESQEAVIRILDEFFREDGTYYRHASLDAQLVAQRQTANKQSTKGREAANKRWGKNTSTETHPQHPQSSANRVTSQVMPGALPEQYQLKSEVKTIGDESPITPLVESVPQPAEASDEREITQSPGETTPATPEIMPVKPIQLALFPLLAPVTTRQTENIKDVYVYWQTVMQHPQAKLTRERITKIRARLREGYTVENLKQAIDGARQDAFLMGDNDRQTRYDDLTTIFKNCGMVERLMETPKHSPLEHHAGNPGYRGHCDGSRPRPSRYENHVRSIDKLQRDIVETERALAEALGGAAVF